MIEWYHPIIAMVVPFIISFIFGWKYEKSELFLIGIVVGTIFGGSLVYLHTLEVEELALLEKQRLQSALQRQLDHFNTLDCKEKGDHILSEYMIGNRTKPYIEPFKKAGCQFDVATQIMLEGSR
jgi:hypothetical protein